LLTVGLGAASEPSHVPDELILGIPDEITASRVPWQALGLVKVKKLGTLPLYLARIVDGIAAVEKKAALSVGKVYGIGSVDLNLVREAAAVYSPLPFPNDPYYQNGDNRFDLWRVQWDQAVNETVGGMNAWSLGGPFSVVLSVIDTGINSIHEDFAGRLLTGWNGLHPVQWTAGTVAL
jgi:hypothetical protein